MGINSVIGGVCKYFGVILGLEGDALGQYDGQGYVGTIYVYLCPL